MKKLPFVSVLVHTRNSERTIEQHLESIKNQSYKNTEIIVVDNQSTDKTIRIVRKYTKKVFTFGPERSAQRNYGAKKATGDYFLVPDSDMILGKNVISESVKCMEHNQDIKAIVIPEKSIGKGFWARCKALERSFYVGVSWMEGARFFRREVFFELQGYDENNTGTEDFDLPQRIERIYGSKGIGRIDEFIIHDEGNLSLFNTMKKKFYYARDLEVYKKSNDSYFQKQASLLVRYKLYFSHMDTLLNDPFLGIGMLFMKTLEFIAGGFGYATRKF